MKRFQTHKYLTYWTGFGCDWLPHQQTSHQTLTRTRNKMEHQLHQPQPVQEASCQYQVVQLTEYLKDKKTPPNYKTTKSTQSYHMTSFFHTLEEIMYTWLQKAVKIPFQVLLTTASLKELQVTNVDTIWSVFKKQQRLVRPSKQKPEVFCKFTVDLSTWIYKSVSFELTLPGCFCGTFFF